MAAIYQSKGRYAEAEPLYAQALQLRREVLGERHLDTITSLNNLASIYESEGRYAKAEPLFAQALQLRREVLGERHPAIWWSKVTGIGNVFRFVSAGQD